MAQALPCSLQCLRDMGTCPQKDVMRFLRHIICIYYNLGETCMCGAQFDHTITKLKTCPKAIGKVED